MWTGMPALAKHIAIPPPIVPDPIIPAFLISMTFVSLGTSDIFDAARSPKNMWIIASLWGWSRHSRKYSPSFFKPSSKSSRFIADSTHLIICPGANCPFLVFAANAWASSITLSSPLASIIFSFLSLTFGWFSTLSDTSLTNAIASSTTFSDILSTMPICNALVAGTWPPESIIFRASPGPTSLGSLWVPPPPGKSPKLTSGRPTKAFLSAIL